jgi:hypothetical protein
VDIVVLGYNGGSKGSDTLETERPPFAYDGNGISHTGSNIQAGSGSTTVSGGVENNGVVTDTQDMTIYLPPGPSEGSVADNNGYTAWEQTGTSNNGNNFILTEPSGDDWNLDTDTLTISSTGSGTVDGTYDAFCGDFDFDSDANYMDVGIKTSDTNTNVPSTDGKELDVFIVDAGTDGYLGDPC